MTLVLFTPVTGGRVRCALRCSFSPFFVFRFSQYLVMVDTSPEAAAETAEDSLREGQLSRLNQVVVYFIIHLTRCLKGGEK